MPRKTRSHSRPAAGRARARRRAATVEPRPGRAEPTGATPFHQSCILGLLLEGHLGDALCTTPLARQLVQEKGMTVQVTDHPNTRVAFANNPFVSGYSTARGFSPLAWREGDGHVIQQLQRGLGLQVGEPPRPEVYLSPQERAWASTWLAKHVPAGRKVCVLSAQAVQTAGSYDGVRWDQVSLALQEEYVVVQPLLSATPVAASPVRRTGRARPRPEGQTPGAIVAVDLPTRHYMALVAAADLLVCGFSGGQHVAAAFHVPAIVVVWPELMRGLNFPVRGWGLVGEHFAHPTQAHVVTSSLARKRFDGQAFRDKMQEAQALEPGPRPSSPAAGR